VFDAMIEAAASVAALKSPNVDAISQTSAGADGSGRRKFVSARRILLAEDNEGEPDRGDGNVVGGGVFGCWW